MDKHRNALVAGLLAVLRMGMTPPTLAAPTPCPDHQLLTGVSKQGAGGRCVAAPRPPENAKTTLLSANVGNVDFVACGGPFVYKLCRAAVEQAVGHNLRALAPDLVLLQEVLQPGQCAAPAARRPGTVCAPGFAGGGQHQMGRLLGPGYDWRCAGDYYECVGLKKNSGWVFDGPVTPVAPPAGCDQGFSVSWVRVKGPPGAVKLINAHPDSQSPACRRQHLAQVMEDTVTPALLAGDLNLDPFHAVDKKNNRPGQDDESEAYVNSRVGAGKPWRYLSEDGAPPLVMTNTTGVLDHVLTSHPSLKGSCLTLNGEFAPALDGGQSQMDHHALWCGISFSGQ